MVEEGSPWLFTGSETGTGMVAYSSMGNSPLPSLTWGEAKQLEKKKEKRYR
jgi:hypothetical protein